MFKAFHVMGLSPQGSTAKELDKWITNYNIKKEQKPIVGHSLTLPTTTDDAAVRPKFKHQHATAISSYPPKVRVFSGGDNKIETPYDIWRYDVKMALMDPSYTKEQKEFAIRRSLTGSAARLVMYQGHDKPIDKILDVLDSVYGTVDNKEQLLAEFYSARQRDDEDVTTWSNRLQDIIGKGLEKGLVDYRDMNYMLHAMLWRGLKDISGHKHDMIKDFNQLRVALRQLEKNHQPKKSKPNIVKVISETPESERQDIKELKGMVHQLTTQVNEFKQHQQQPQYYKGNNYRDNRGRRWNNSSHGQQGQNSYQPQHNSYQPQHNSYQPRQNSYQPQHQQTDQQKEYVPQGNTIYCRCCGQEGHIQIGCRVRLDHTTHLNSRKPIRRGRY